MIAGSIFMEDIVLTYALSTDSYTQVDYTVTDMFSKITESFEGVDAKKFFSALSIALHWDGTPDYNKDYGDAESLMREIRWIP